MSADTTQQQLDGTISRHDHLTTTRPQGARHELRSDRERYCLVCGRRVTRDTTDSIQYGHRTNCEHHATLGDVGGVGV